MEILNILNIIQRSEDGSGRGGQTLMRGSENEGENFRRGRESEWQAFSTNK